MIIIYRKIAITVILETSFDKFSSTVRIWNDILNITIEHFICNLC